MLEFKPHGLKTNRKASMILNGNKYFLIYISYSFLIWPLYSSQSSFLFENLLIDPLRHDLEHSEIPFKFKISEVVLRVLLNYSPNPRSNYKLRPKLFQHTETFSRTKQLTTSDKPKVGRSKAKTNLSAMKDYLVYTYSLIQATIEAEESFKRYPTRAKTKANNEGVLLLAYFLSTKVVSEFLQKYNSVNKILNEESLAIGGDNFIKHLSEKRVLAPIQSEIHKFLGILLFENCHLQQEEIILKLKEGNIKFLEVFPLFLEESTFHLMAAVLDVRIEDQELEFSVRPEYVGRVNEEELSKKLKLLSARMGDALDTAEELYAEDTAYDDKYQPIEYEPLEKIKLLVRSFDGCVEQFALILSILIPS